MKKMITITIIILFLLASCNYDVMSNPYTYFSANSESLFVVDGQAYTSYSGHFPLNIYNPNDYAITVKIGNKEYSLAPFTELWFDYDGEQMCIK